MNNINLGTLNLGGMNTSEIKLGYPSSGCPVPGLKGLQGLYMGKGLTNEMMSRDPIWRDKSGKGNHIQLKNFAWGGMSGVGIYVENYKVSRWYLALDRAETIKTDHSFHITSITSKSVAFYYQSYPGQEPFTVKSYSVKVSGLKDGQSIRYGTGGLSVLIINSDGIYELPSFDFVANTAWYGFSFTKIQESCNITIEQIPDYDGAICFDGIDDFGETIKDLNFTDNYSVVSLVVPFYNNRNNILFGKNHLKDVYCNYSTGMSFYSVGRSAVIAGGTSKNHVKLLVCRRNDSVQEIKNIFSNNSNSIISIPIIDNPGKYYLGRSQTVLAYGQFAMFAHAIFDHYISDEELEILSDYWKKEFPELFPNQAWTVTGKTNSDADRATIKNITGNGNDLVLTNFAFEGNSGYGKWPINIVTNSPIFKGQPYGTAHFIADASTYANTITRNVNSINFRIRVREMQEGSILAVWCSTKRGDVNTILKNWEIKENGIYEFEYENTETTFNVAFYNGHPGSHVYWDFYVDILQDPDYEGYLLTDGVDDQIMSSNFILPEKYTIVGDWKLINNTYRACGIIKPNQFYIYNLSNGVRLYVNSNNSAFDVLSKSIKAVCSDGRCYDSEWNEISFVPGSVINSGGALYIGYQGANSTQIAFKNLAIYDNALLTKDQCIRAYNYLQTLKNN